jgi:hypothetical protein
MDTEITEGSLRIVRLADACARRYVGPKSLRMYSEKARPTFDEAVV